MADECECDFNEDEQNGGGDSDEAVEDQMDDAFAAQLGDVQLQNVRNQYEEVGSSLRTLCEKCGKPLKAVIDNEDARGRVVDGPAENPDAPPVKLVPKPYDKMRAADPNDPTYVLIPVEGAPQETTTTTTEAYAPGPAPQDSPVVRDEGDRANAVADADDDVCSCVTKRCVLMVLGCLGAGGLIGTDIYAWYALLADSGGPTNGVGGGSRISLGDPLNFGNVNTGATATLKLKISNTGGTDLHIQSMAVPVGFSGTIPETAKTIASGGSSEVTLTFTPVLGQVYAGNIIVNSDATFGTNTTGVSGLGVVPAPSPVPAPAIGLAGFLDFGSVTSGLTTTRYLTIFNSGTATLNVTGVTVPDGFAANCIAAIAAGSSVLVTVTFTPTAAQAYSGSLTVLSNVKTGTSTIALSGTGVAMSGDPDTDCATTANHLVSEWNHATNEAAFWTAASNWAGTATGSPPSLPSYQMQLMVLLFAFNIAIHEMPPVVPLNADIDDLANQLNTARTNDELDNKALYLRASTLTSKTGVPLYRYEKINVLTRVIGLILHAASNG